MAEVTTSNNDREYDDHEDANNIIENETQRDDGNRATAVLQTKRTRDPLPLPPTKRRRLTTTTTTTTTTISAEPISPLPVQQSRACNAYKILSSSKSPPHQVLPHPLSPLPSEDPTNVSLLDHDFQNIVTQFQNIGIQYPTASLSDGYNHLKVVEKLSQPSTDCKLPSWLADISQLPPLPVLGDPRLFLTFYDLRYRQSIRTFSNVISSKPKPHRIHHPCASQFRALVFRGNAKLSCYANSILADLLGRDNRVLHNFVHVNWNLNQTTEELARLYRLNDYVNWCPQSPREIRGAKKYWVDLWKAWWGACFLEREVWGDDVEDLLSCLRRIMAMKYQGLVHEYSTNRQVIRQRSSDHDRMNVVGHEQVVVRPVRRGNVEICQCLGPVAANYENKIVLGYVATIRDSAGISIYATDESRAVSTVMTYANRGFKEVLQQDTQFLIQYPLNKVGNSIRQQSFDLFVEIYFDSSQPLSDSVHLTPLLRRVQYLRKEMLQLGICPTNHLARVFFYEAQLALQIKEYTTAINALTFVISYGVLLCNTNRLVLQQCILLSNRIFHAKEYMNHDLANFILKYTPLVGGKLIIHGREIVSWGNDVMDVIVKLRFEEDYLHEIKEKGETSFCPFEFMSAWSRKNGF